MENNTLSHYGIRGMKWGVRRYQNKDGSLTPAGKKRYGNEETADLERRIEAENAKGSAYRKKAYQYERDIMEGRKQQNDADDQEWTKNIRESDKHYANARKLHGELVDASKRAVAEGNKKPKAAEQPAKKSIKDMSDDELRSAVARLELEKRYKDLSPKPETPFSKKIIDEAVKPAATEAAKQVARDFLTKMSKKALGLDDKGDDGEAAIKALQKEVNKLDLERRYKELTTNDETAEAVKRLKTMADKYKYEEKIRDYENNQKPKDDDDDDDEE